jgi:general stress protein 26
MQRNDTDFSKLWELIGDIRFAMLTIQHRDGTLRARPMTTQNGKEDRGGTLWFFASRHGEPVLDLQQAPDVNVSYAHTGKDAYVSVAGKARIVDDIERKRALFGTIAKAWFPGGPEDPNLALISVAIEHAEYWDVKSNQLTQLIKMAASAITGKPVQLATDHGEIGRR